MAFDYLIRHMCTFPPPEPMCHDPNLCHRKNLWQESGTRRPIRIHIRVFSRLQDPTAIAFLIPLSWQKRLEPQIHFGHCQLHLTQLVQLLARSKWHFVRCTGRKSSSSCKGRRHSANNLPHHHKGGIQHLRKEQVTVGAAASNSQRLCRATSS